MSAASAAVCLSCPSGFLAPEAGTVACDVAACPDHASGSPLCECDPGYYGVLGFVPLQGWVTGSCYGPVLDSLEVAKQSTEPAFSEMTTEYSVSGYIASLKLTATCGYPGIAMFVASSYIVQVCYQH